MYRMKGMGLLIFFAMIFASVPVSADIYWESLVESKGKPQGMSANLPQILMGHMNKSETVKYYLSEKGLRTESGDGVMVMDFSSMTVYTLYPKNRTYMKTEMASMQGGPKDASPDRSDIQITPTEEKKEISGYSCRKYLVKTKRGEGEYWVSEDVKVLEAYKQIQEKMKKKMGNQPGMNRMKIPGLMENIDGFPIMTQMEVMGITTTTTVKNIAEKKTDESLYRLPDDYKLLDIKNIFNIKPPTQ